MATTTKKKSVKKTTKKQNSKAVSKIVKDDIKQQSQLTAQWDRLEPAVRIKVLKNYFKKDIPSETIDQWSDMDMSEIEQQDGYKTIMGIMSALLEFNSHPPKNIAYARSKKALSATIQPVKPKQVVKGGIYYLNYSEGVKNETQLCLVEANGFQRNKGVFTGICLIDESRFQQAGDLSDLWDFDAFTLLPGIESCKF